LPFNCQERFEKFKNISFVFFLKKIRNERVDVTMLMDGVQKRLLRFSNSDGNRWQRCVECLVYLFRSKALLSPSTLLPSGSKTVSASPFEAGSRQ